MLCGYCAADTQSGETHSVQCQVFRTLNDNPAAVADPYSASVAAVLAAAEFAYREGHSMRTQEYNIIRTTLNLMKSMDPYIDEDAEGQYGRVPL